MIPYQLDPSLHTAPPPPTELGDGFTPPQQPQGPVPDDEEPDDGYGLAGEPSLF